MTDVDQQIEPLGDDSNLFTLYTWITNVLCCIIGIIIVTSNKNRELFRQRHIDFIYPIPAIMIFVGSIIIAWLVIIVNDNEQAFSFTAIRVAYYSINYVLLAVVMALVIMQIKKTESITTVAIGKEKRAEQFMSDIESHGLLADADMQFENEKSGLIRLFYNTLHGWKLSNKLTGNYKKTIGSSTMYKILLSLLIACVMFGLLFIFYGYISSSHLGETYKLDVITIMVPVIYGVSVTNGVFLILATIYLFSYNSQLYGLKETSTIRYYKSYEITLIAVEWLLFGVYLLVYPYFGMDYVCAYDDGGCTRDYDVLLVLLTRVFALFYGLQVFTVSLLVLLLDCLSKYNISQCIKSETENEGALMTYTQLYAKNKLNQIDIEYVRNTTNRSNLLAYQEDKAHVGLERKELFSIASYLRSEKNINENEDKTKNGKNKLSLEPNLSETSNNSDINVKYEKADNYELMRMINNSQKKWHTNLCWYWIRLSRLLPQSNEEAATKLLILAYYDFKLFLHVCRNEGIMESVEYIITLVQIEEILQRYHIIAQHAGDQNCLMNSDYWPFATFTAKYNIESIRILTKPLPMTREFENRLINAKNNNNNNNLTCESALSPVKMLLTNIKNRFYVDDARDGIYKLNVDHYDETENKIQSEINSIGTLIDKKIQIMIKQRMIVNKKSRMCWKARSKSYIELQCKYCRM